MNLPAFVDLPRGSSETATCSRCGGVKMIIQRKVRPLAEHFWLKVDRNGPIHPVLLTQCWNWTARRGRGGYGRITLSRPTRGQTVAHRVAWELTNGPIADGLRVLHHCDNPACCNPSHLFLGTILDNNRDRDKKGRNGRSRRTHCVHGHEYIEGSYTLDRGARRCKTCNAIRAQAAR
jgi:hypothetical protein